ncbi:MAG: redoxin family protein, partial [Planctomycetes bacterium]|nr:redoxin family protein [Planctomycetota bacterium]
DQKSTIDGMLETYGDDPPAVDSRYGLAAQRDGDRGRAKKLEGKPLPVTVFEKASGGKLDVAAFRGDKAVLLIVLRGYASRVCVYCFEQMIAYKRSELLERWRGQVEILVVYPGPREGLDAFRRQFEKEPDFALPDFPVLYDPNLALTKALDIVDEQAIPTTLIIDRDGVVRFAYVGESIEDRPSSKLLDRQLQRHVEKR